MRVPRLLSRLGLGCALITSGFAACECDELGDLSALGSFEPATYNYGLVVTGQTCIAELELINGGQADLTVNESKFLDVNGDFSIDGVVPGFVGAFGSDMVRINYTAGSAGGGSEGATFWIKTNTPENDGVLTAMLRGTPVASDSAFIATECDEVSPCDELSFGATVVATNNPGVVRSLKVINDGTAQMNVLEPVVLDNPDFTIDSARTAAPDGLGGTVEVTDWPVQLDPSRGECGADAGNSKTWVEINVRYQPAEIGGDAGTLRVDTDAAVDPSSVDFSLVGVGSGDGIEIEPDIIQFGEVQVGASDTQQVRVFNLRLDNAPVNNTCLDTDRDDACDIDCTAIDEGVALSCGVEKTDGSHEGKGFVLAAADAQAGGDDERNIKVRWAPEAAGPLRAQLLLETSIQGSRVWKVLVNGGAAGTLSPSVDPLVIPGSGDPLAGSLDFTIGNTGEAPLTITGIAFEGASSITSEFTLTRSGDGGFSVNGETPWAGSMSIAIDANEPFHMEYTNSGVLNCDTFDIYFSHDGSGQVPYILTVEVDGDAC